MKKNNDLIRLKISALRSIASALLLGVAATAGAQESGTSSTHTFGAQVALGVAQHKVKKVDLGLVWDPGINWWDVGGWHFSLVGEAHLAYWHTNEGAFHNDVYEFGVTPIELAECRTDSARAVIALVHACARQTLRPRAPRAQP